MRLPSLPLRKCGLKLCFAVLIQTVILSLPLRKCGLKFGSKLMGIKAVSVTSLAEVWIEIYDK